MKRGSGIRVPKKSKIGEKRSNVFLTWTFFLSVSRFFILPNDA